MNREPVKDLLKRRGNPVRTFLNQHVATPAVSARHDLKEETAAILISKSNKSQSGKKRFDLFSKIKVARSNGSFGSPFYYWVFQHLSCNKRVKIELSCQGPAPSFRKRPVGFFLLILLQFRAILPSPLLSRYHGNGTRCRRIG